MIHTYPVLVAIGVGSSIWAADRILNDKMNFRKALKGKATKQEINEVIEALVKARDEDRLTHKQFKKVNSIIRRINKYEK